MQGLIDDLMDQSVITDAEALTSLIYGCLSEEAFWIAEGDQGSDRLEHALKALRLLLRGVLVESHEV